MDQRTGPSNASSHPPRRTGDLKPSDPCCAGLTARERDVVTWLAEGDTDREIASRLGVSHRTVHKHLEHVYRKLGVATRTAAVMRLFRRSTASQSTQPPGPAVNRRPSR